MSGEAVYSSILLIPRGFSISRLDQLRDWGRAPCLMHSDVFNRAINAKRRGSAVLISIAGPFSIRLSRWLISSASGFVK